MRRILFLSRPSGHTSSTDGPKTWKPSRLRSLLFKGSDWVFSWDGKVFTLSCRGWPPVRGSLPLIHSFTFTPANALSQTVDCKFVFHGEKDGRTCKGLKLPAVKEFEKFLIEETPEKLAECAGRAQSALDRWATSTTTKMKTLGMVRPEQVAEWMKEIPLPLIAGLERWEVLFDHPLFDRSRKKFPGVFPSVLVAPSQYVADMVEAHNRREFDRLIEQWLRSMAERLEVSGWIGHRAQEKMWKDTPLPEWIDKPWALVAPQALKNDPHGWWVQKCDAHNAAFESSQMASKREFFDQVEAQPLTDEQRRAVICMDDELLVVAAAGSGKSSTIVAKAGYALQEGLCEPEEILLLAFNADAAADLRSRIAHRLGHIPGAERITAKTFHAFGLEVIGAATGEMPSTAPWLNGKKDVEYVGSLVDGLCAGNAEFANDWHMFRLIYSKALGRWDALDEPEDYDPITRRKRGFKTRQGEMVKSKEERLIADWLFLHGVNYEYEPPYPVNTRTGSHRQYRPDFFYKDIGVFHEHFALDEHGNAPAEFVGYKDGVIWKRGVHQTNATTLFETTSHELRSGAALRSLKRMFNDRGVKLVFNPHRKGVGREPDSSQAIAKLLRVFQQHMKSSRQDIQTAYERIKVIEDAFEPRMRLFLALYGPVAALWEERLNVSGLVDYDDMINLPADLVEANRYPCKFKMVLADEFQDTSVARMRLIQSILQVSGAQFTAVGDDWQSIYRFAGADVGVMTGFTRRFPTGKVRYLTKTFRCPQDICDLSSAFILKNPRQIAKAVISSNNRAAPSIKIQSLPAKENIQGYVAQQIRKLYSQLPSDGAAGQKLKVMLLGRYRNDFPFDEFLALRQQLADRIDLHSLTVHSSKGLEADVVLLLNVVQDTRGFPSLIEDDPILQLAMAEHDDMPLGEERRLFYVALTRCRRSLMVYTTQGQPSEFVVEMQKEHGVPVSYVDGIERTVCPACEVGLMTSKQNTQTLAYFNSCTRFPKCNGQPLTWPD